MIEVSGLRKSYPPRRADRFAVDGVSLLARPGRIYSLLGLSGSGKTTVLRCIAGFLRPDTGEISVDDVDAVADPAGARARTACLGSAVGLPRHLTPREVLLLHGQLRRLPRGPLEKLVRDAIGRLGPEAADRPLARLPRRAVRECSLIAHTIHDPKVILFDEPEGLEMDEHRAVVDFLVQARDAGKTVIIASRATPVAERLGDTVAFLVAGRIAAEGGRRELARNFGVSSLEEAYLAAMRGAEPQRHRGGQSA